MYKIYLILNIIVKVQLNMTPGLPEKYREKTKLREVTCSGCQHVMATRMRIPQCAKCGAYTEEK